MAVVYQPNSVALQQTGPQPPIQVVANQPAMMVLQSPNTGRSERYNAKSARVTGWIQLSCAIAAFAINVVELLLGSTVSIVGTGIWAGLLFFLPTGILGIVSKNKSTCMIIAYMVMSIISAVVGFVVFCMGITAASVSGYQTCSFIGIWNCGYDVQRARIAFDVFLVFTGLVELVVAIVAACYCCAGVCCGRTNNTSTMVYQHSNNVTPVVMMVPAHAQPAGQPMGYPNPPPANQPHPYMAQGGPHQGPAPQLGPGPQPGPEPQPFLGPQQGPGPQPNYNMGAPSPPPHYHAIDPVNPPAQPMKM
ncbi:uncharacterized protein LOC135153912 [Lytechinus pictus]|uniref:uncharacterized protein LOC135153912 n=1 Tax=Lytechinus pictus TaxID=7653 RepID=UPI0030BA01B2